MNKIQIGKMYLVKDLWFLYPTKELAAERASGARRFSPAAVGRPDAQPRGAELEVAAAYKIAKWMGEQYNCNVAVVEENTCVVLLEQDEKYFKLLDSNGNIGWIYCRDFSKYLELVKE